MPTANSDSAAPATPQAEFRHTLELYLAELGADPCYEQARQYYASQPPSRLLRLDRWGSPAEQLRRDARSEGKEFLAETAEAIQRLAILVWQPGRQPPKARYRADRFSEAAAHLVPKQELSRFHFAPDQRESFRFHRR